MRGDIDIASGLRRKSEGVFSTSTKLPGFSLGAPCHPHRQHLQHPEQDPTHAVVATSLLRALARLPLNSQPPGDPLAHQGRPRRTQWLQKDDSQPHYLE